MSWRRKPLWHLAPALLGVLLFAAFALEPETPGIRPAPAEAPPAATGEDEAEIPAVARAYQQRALYAQARVPELFEIRRAGRTAGTEVACAARFS